MAAAGYQTHKPPSRQASLQRMLDLEKKYKMARLHSAQTSPVAESVTSFLPSPKPTLQARRRDSRESLLRQHSDSFLQSPRRVRPPPALSIAIPPAESEEQSAEAMARNRLLRSDDSTPREKTVTFLAPAGDEDEGVSDDDLDEVDRMSLQSSICHSPSWEGYGSSKKKKKEAAEQRRREKEKAEQEVKAAKKRLANTLKKQRTGEGDAKPQSAERSSGGLLVRLESRKSTSAQSVKSTKSKQSIMSQLAFIGPDFLFAVSAGGYVGGPTGPSPYAKDGLKAIMPPPGPKPGSIATSEPIGTKSLDLAVPSRPRTATNEAHMGTDAREDADDDSLALPIQNDQYLGNERRGAPLTQKSPRSMTMTDATNQGMSYPPQASRSYILRHTSGNVHGRSNSASAATAAKMEEASKFFRAHGARSTQASKLYAAANDSEETLQDHGATNENARGRGGSNSYVRQSRQRSTDRAMAGLADDFAISSMSQPQISPDTPQFSLFAGGRSDGHDKAEPQHGDAEQPDYFNFITRPYSPPALDLTPPPGGLISSIKSRMTRRSSSGASTPQLARGLKDRAADGSQPSHKSPDTAVPRSISASAPPSAVQSPKNNIPADFGQLPARAARAFERSKPEPIPPQQPQAGSRPSEGGSSTSSYHDDSSAPPSRASTPDTSRPQSTRGLSAAIEEIQKGSPKMFMTHDDEAALSQRQYRPMVAGPPSDHSRSSTKAARERKGTRAGARSASDGRRSESNDRPRASSRLDTDRPSSKGRPLGEISRPSSRGRPLDDLDRPASKGRMLGSVERPTSPQGLGIMDDHFSRTAMPLDIDDHALVTGVENADTSDSKSSLADSRGSLPLPTPDEPSRSSSHGSDRSRTSSKHSRLDDEMATSGGRDRDGSRSRSSRRRDKRSSSHSKHMSVVREEPKSSEDVANVQAALDEKRELDPESVDVSFLPRLRHEALLPPKGKARDGSRSPRLAPGVEPPRAHSKSPMVLSEPSSRSSSPSAAYLQEARRTTAPLVPSPLSNSSRQKSNSSAKSTSSAPAVIASRPGNKPSDSPPLVSASRPALLPALKNSQSSTNVPQYRIPAQEPEAGGKPVAKMLVECCSCKFFHDMPSRVYECMAQPDAVVTDRSLGVSGAITTMVKCPWCSHNMSTRCCAGYAAVLYLKERLH